MLDIDGVGELVKFGVECGCKECFDLVFLVCGEYGGSFELIVFC